MARAVGDPVVLRDALNSGEINVGQSLWFFDGNNNGQMAQYIIVHKDPGNQTAVLMRKTLTSVKSVYRPSLVQNAQSHYVRVYDGSNIDQYLTGTFFSNIPSEYKNILVDRRIKYLDLQNIGGWTSVIRTIDRKVFAPSAIELSHSDVDAVDEGTPFSYFNTSYGRLNRQLQVSQNGGNGAYWTRTRNKKATGEGEINNALYIKTDGTAAWAVKSTEMYMPICLSIRTDIIVSLTSAGIWWITPDLPPNKVSTSVQEHSVRNDVLVSISWSAATDPFNATTQSYIKASDKHNGLNNNVGYVVREVLYKEGSNEPETEDHYVSSVLSYDTSYSYNDKVYYAEYYVQSVDRWGNYSDWSKVATVNVTNNAPPYAPGTITFVGGKKNEKISLAWATSYDSEDRLDPDDNFRGYNVYRQINGAGELQLISNGQRDNQYSEIAGDWDSVRYYVSAVDQDNAESERSSVLILLTSRVTVQLDVDSGSEIQAADTEASAPTVTTGAADVAHSITFQITETDSDKSDHDYTVEAIAEGITVTPMIVAGDDDVSSAGTLVLSISRDQWMQIPNGTHRVRVDVRDNDDQDNQLSKTFFFKKSCTTAVLEISGDNAILLDNPDITNVTQYMLQIDGEFPTGSSLSVQVSRNADEADPQDIEWETATIDGTFVSFSSTAQGAAMGIRVTLDRGTATDPCYIKSIHGMFGRNWFKWIESVLRDNHLIT